MKHPLETPQGTILLRQARPADAMAYRDLRLHALQDSPVAFTADYQRNLSQPPKFWEDLLTMHANEQTLFLAEHEGRLVGMTGIVRGSSPKTRHSATIWGVYVMPDWRGLHIAEQLIQCCLAWARERQIVGARLEVTTTNQSAIRCYERCGFRITGTEPRALYHEGNYYDFSMMYRPLDND